MGSRSGRLNAAEVLRPLPENEAFHFFEDINEYTGKSASNLIEFCDMTKTVNRKSITFHFKRHDFEKWTTKTLHDPTLARRISKLRKLQSEEKLSEEKVRTLIYQITKRRVGELNKKLHKKRHRTQTGKLRKHKATKKKATSPKKVRTKSKKTTQKKRR